MDVPRPPVRWSTVRQLTRRGVLWLGLKCDVRCKFCYDDLVASRDKGWLAAGDAFAMLDKFRGFYRNEFVDLMGGEPTLHPQAVEIVAYAARIGLRPTVITHGMHLADPQRAYAFAKAGVHDFLVSLHGSTAATVAAVHGRGRDNFARQMTALDNLHTLGVPVRLNVTMIGDNVAELPAIVDIAAAKGARVVNFLTFNPYFEWASRPQIVFQARHSQIAPQLVRAIKRCNAAGIEANVRYLPICQLPGYEQHVYTGYQLPYDPHEWDYNSWYDTGNPGQPDPRWYLQASHRQRRRHQYTHVPACGDCALQNICDGFHRQYLARWGPQEARPHPGPPVADPRHFITAQPKLAYDLPEPAPPTADDTRTRSAARLRIGDDGRAGPTQPKATT